MKLHAKLLLLLVPLIALPLLVLGLAAYSQQRDNLEQESLRQVQTLLNQIEHQWHSQLQASLSNLSLFSKSGVLERYLQVEDEAQRFQVLQPNLLRLFRRYQTAYPQYYEIRILLPDGYEDTRSTLTVLPNATDDEAETDYFRSLTTQGDEAVARVILNPDNDMQALLVSQVIKSIDPKVDPIRAEYKLRGYLVITSNLDFLVQQSELVEFGHGGFIFYTDATGRRVLVSETMNRDGHTLPAGTRGILERGIQTGQSLSSGHLVESLLLTGHKLHDNLYVFAALPKQAIVESSRRLTLVTLGILMVTVMLTSGLLYAVLNATLFKPLAKLGHAAVAIGQGHEVLDIGISNSDEIGELANIFEDMGRNLRQSHEQLSHIAYHDSLTNLPNRRLFCELLEHALALGARNQRCVAVLFLDLDDFKNINDSMGHQVGDELLREVARTLSNAVRASDLVSHESDEKTGNSVARLGGDEFVILLADLGGPLDAAIVAQRILDRFKRTIVVGDYELPAKTSIGISTFPDDGDSGQHLMKNADIAMYHAKEKGKNHYQFFTATMNSTLMERLAMEQDLRKALENGEFLLYYQPQVNTYSGEILGTEALIRWDSPEKGMIPPGKFIQLAEDTGLIIPIGNWVIREACLQNKRWQDAGFAPITVSVNISGRQFSADGLKDSVINALIESGLDSSYLDLELTETAIMDDPTKSIDLMRELKQYGVKISMDDFGTGYSSLGMLKRLPIDCLKIDQGFVRDIATNTDDAAITETIIAMSKSLNLEVIAEGVETPEQLAYLREHHCERIQGYLASRPVPPDMITEILSSRRQLLDEYRLIGLQDPAPSVNIKGA